MTMALERDAQSNESEAIPKEDALNENGQELDIANNASDVLSDENQELCSDSDDLCGQCDDEITQEPTQHIVVENEEPPSNQTPSIVSISEPTDDKSEDDFTLAKEKNGYLHTLLTRLRASDTKHRCKSDDSSNSVQLERTYKKALSDYMSACDQLDRQTESCSKNSAQLRQRLQEKEDKAENLTMTLQKYRADIAQQSSFANGKIFDMDTFDELTSRGLDDDLERERLRNTTNRVNVMQLEQKIRKKNELAGGISHIEFHHLEEEIKKSDAKIKFYDENMEKINSDEQTLLKLESSLQLEIQTYSEKNESTEHLLKDMDDKIEKKRAYLGRLETTSKSTQKKIGYDAADIGAFLKTKMVNDDFASSKDELRVLHTKLDKLKLHHARLTN